MAVEQVEHEYGSKETVEHFFSPVVETIALVSSLINAEDHDFARDDHAHLMDELSQETRDFIGEWKLTMASDLLEMLNFLIPCPFYYEADQFIESVANLSDEEFLYHFFGEAVSHDQLMALFKEPVSLRNVDTHVLWDTQTKREMMIDLLSNIKTYRQNIAHLLKQVSHSQLFKNRMKKCQPAVDKVILDLKSMKMEPLALAQFIMGKTFQRTSLYKVYHFIPSYFFTPHRMRVFNSDICIVFYGCAEPLSDLRQQSIELENLLKALSDRNRLLMLRMLSNRKEYGAKLSEYLGITTATVSHHLEILKKAGLVQEEKIGTIKYFSAEADHIKSVIDEVNQFISK